MAWKLNYSDINVYSGRNGAATVRQNGNENVPIYVFLPRDFQFQPTMRAQSLMRKSRASFGSLDNQVFVTVGNYHGTVVAVKSVRKPRIEINRAMLQEMQIVSAE